MLNIRALTVCRVYFETPVCKLYLLFLSADAATKKEKKVLLPTGVLKSTAHTVHFNPQISNLQTKQVKCISNCC